MLEPVFLTTMPPCPPFPYLFFFTWGLNTVAALRSGNIDQFTEYWMFCWCLSERQDWKIISQLTWVNISLVLHTVHFLIIAFLRYKCPFGDQKVKVMICKDKRRTRHRTWGPWICSQSFPAAQAPTLLLCEEFVFSFLAFFSWWGRKRWKKSFLWIGWLFYWGGRISFRTNSIRAPN